MSKGPFMTQAVEAFFETVRRSNPFRYDRVSNVPALAVEEGGAVVEEFVDVPAIHAKEFHRLNRLVQEVRTDHHSIGVMLMGQAGVGKSHLLARLCQTVDQKKSAFFVYLHNVMASPEQMPRHFLRSVISVLVEGRESYKDCALYRLVRDVAKEFIRKANLPQTLKAKEARRVFFRGIDQLHLRSDPVNAQISEVLYRFFERVNLDPTLRGATHEIVDNIVNWLSGDAISEDAAKKIGLSIVAGDETEEAEVVRLEDIRHIKQVLLILCELAALSNRTLLICLDQVDNLQPPQIQSLFSFLHAFVDHARNLLLVSAGTREAMEKRRANDITEAQWHRLAQVDISLTQCTPVLMRELLEARLHSIATRFKPTPELTRYFEQNPLFPLSANEFEKQFGTLAEVRPRFVLRWAADAWQDQQDRIEELGAKNWLKEWEVKVPTPPPQKLNECDVIDETVNQAINQMIADRREHPGALPPDSDNLAALTERLLECCLTLSGLSLESVRRLPAAGRKLQPFQLEVTERVPGTERRVTSGVAFVTSRNPNSASSALNRLRNASQKLDHRILVTDEERAPLPTTPKAREYYQSLLDLGSDSFQHIKLNFQQYVELDALRSAIDQAADLTIEYPRGQFRNLTRQDVIDSMHRQQKFLKHPLLAELLTESGGDKSSDDKSRPFPDSNLIKTVIKGKLGWRISITSNNVTEELLQKTEFRGLAYNLVYAKVTEAIRDLERDQEIVVKEHLNSLLLMNVT